MSTAVRLRLHRAHPAQGPADPVRHHRRQLRRRTGHGEHFDNNSWNCLGCGDASRSPEKDYLFRIRPDANNHATACRAIPLT